MENFIEYINISNFKSIRNLKLEGLSRINLLIGKPNVGKSNILEAFGLLGLDHLNSNLVRKLSNYLRLTSQWELFFDGHYEEKINIETNIGECQIIKNPSLVTQLDENWIDLPNQYLVCIIQILNSSLQMIFDSNLKLFQHKEFGNNIYEELGIVKFYNFPKEIKSRKSQLNSLIPPNGINLMNIIEIYPKLKNEIKEIFHEYNLNLIFDKTSHELKIAKPPSKGEMSLIPFSSIADTLQRIIFYKTAIASNKNSVLIFEEPEAHAFPPYIVHITQEIIEAKSNQFILSTHSPYVLEYFLENAIDETSIFMVDYKNGETVTNKLSKEDVSDILRYGIDLFTNYETFLK